MDSSACGRPGAALTVHRTVIHSRPSNPFLSNAKKEDELCSSSFFGGRGWIRTIVVCDNGFTVRSLWPLGNPSVFNLNIDIITHFARMSIYIILKYFALCLYIDMQMKYN